MTFELSRAGLDVDWSADLPFNNRVAVQFNIPTGLERPDPSRAFDLHQNTHLWLLFAAGSLAEGAGTDGKQLRRLIQPWRDGLLSGATVGNDKFRDRLVQGLWDADKSAPYNDPVMNALPTFLSHFYDPDTRTNWLGQPGPTAVSEGVRFYRKSVRAFRRGNLRTAGHALGLALHYLTDLTQPMHASNFTVLDTRAPGYHVRFEGYVKRVLHEIVPPRAYTSCLEETTPEAFFHEVARYSKDTYLRAITDPAWMRDLNGKPFDDPAWHHHIGRIVPFILGDAAQLAAQFLLMWYREATGK